MTDPEQADAFDIYLKRRSVLPSGAPIDDNLKPPASLDEFVLRKARDAIESQETTGSAAPKQPAASRPPRWVMPVGVAAIVLLCLSIVLNVNLNAARPGVSSQRITTADEATPQAPSAGAPEVGASGAFAAAPAEARADEPRMRESAVDKTAMFAKRAGVAAPAGVVRGASARAANTTESNSGTPSSGVGAPSEPHPADPETWLHQIEALRIGGKTARADAEMAQFRAVFPGYSAKPSAPAASESRFRPPLQ
jgi:hypothetical protein